MRSFTLELHLFILPVATWQIIWVKSTACAKRCCVMAQRVDFNKLDTVALKRYRRFHKLDDVGPNPTKEELVSAVAKHFTAQVAIVFCCMTLFLTMSSLYACALQYM